MAQTLVPATQDAPVVEQPKVNPETQPTEAQPYEHNEVVENYQN